RYFEYSAAFIYAVFIYYICKREIDVSIVFWLLLFQIAAILVNFLYSQREEIKEKLMLAKPAAFRYLIDYLKTRQGLKLLSIPTKWNFMIATFLDNTDAIFYYDNICDYDKIDGLKYMEEDYIALYYVKPDMNYFAEKYGINTVVMQKQSLKYAETQGINYKFKEEDKLFENELYLVYKINR
ncbi:MAG: hypothetical protein KKF54_05335, partial [Candidatus Omnitrophica bacterium]|nr:hypothetical protein [Candidatus Omnitrophota bacterium]